MYISVAHVRRLVAIAINLMNGRERVHTALFSLFCCFRLSSLPAYPAFIMRDSIGPLTATEFFHCHMVDLEHAFLVQTYQKRLGTITWFDLKFWVIMLWDVCYFCVTDQYILAHHI